MVESRSVKRCIKICEKRAGDDPTILSESLAQAMFWPEASTYLSHRADTICLGKWRLIISDDETRDFPEICTVFEFNSNLNSPKLFSSGMI